MRYLVISSAILSLLAGCASFEEAYHLDREYGQASRQAWDMQVAYPDYRHVDKVPETTEGITAEEIMEVHNQTFAEEPQQIDVFQLGIGQ